MKTQIFKAILIPLAFLSLGNFVMGEEVSIEKKVNYTTLDMGGISVPATVSDEYRYYSYSGKVGSVSIYRTIELSGVSFLAEKMMTVPFSKDAPCDNFANILVSDYGKLVWKSTCDSLFFENPKHQQQSLLTFSDRVVIKQTFYVYRDYQNPEQFAPVKPVEYSTVLVTIKDQANTSFCADPAAMLYKKDPDYNFYSALIGPAGISYLDACEIKADQRQVPVSDLEKEMAISVYENSFSLVAEKGGYCLGFNGTEKKEFYGQAGWVNNSAKEKENRYAPEVYHNTCAQFKNNGNASTIKTLEAAARGLFLPSLTN